MRVFVASFFAVGFLLAQFSSPDLGFATYESGDQTRVTAGLPPALLAWSVLAIPFVLFLIKRRVPSDWLVGFPLVIGIMGVMLLYFAVPVVRGTQTVGCYLLRLKVVPVDGWQPRLYDATKRAVLGYLGLCMGPLTFWRGRGADGSTWYDRSTQFRVRLVRYCD